MHHSGQFNPLHSCENLILPTVWSEEGLQGPKKHLGKLHGGTDKPRAAVSTDPHSRHRGCSPAASQSPEFPRCKQGGDKVLYFYHCLFVWVQTLDKKEKASQDLASWINHKESEVAIPISHTTALAPEPGHGRLPEAATMF